MKSFEDFRLKLAQAKARVWLRLSYLYRNSLIGTFDCLMFTFDCLICTSDCLICTDSGPRLCTPLPPPGSQRGIEGCQWLQARLGGETVLHLAILKPRNISATPLCFSVPCCVACARCRARHRLLCVVPKPRPKPRTGRATRRFSSWQAGFTV